MSVIDEAAQPRRVALLLREPPWPVLAQNIDGYPIVGDRRHVYDCLEQSFIGCR